MEAGKKRSQDDFRRLLHKQAETPLYAAAEADSAAAEDELDEDEIEDNLWGDELPDAKEITAEQARRNAIANTSSKGGALNRPLPPGWVERTSKKKAAGKVYYVNLKTKKYQRDRPVPPELDELLQPKAKKMKVKPKVSSVEDALTRLEIAMKKEEKFGKALGMFIGLMDQKLDEANRDVFMGVVGRQIARRDMVHAPKHRPEYVRLVKSVIKLREKLAPEVAPTLELWEFDVCTNARLNTDDTFGFASIIAVVRQQLESRLPKPLGGGNMQGSSTAAGEWEVAILDCVKTATSYYKFNWAKTPVAGLVGKAYDHRYALSADNKAKVEKWQRLIKSMRS